MHSKSTIFIPYLIQTLQRRLLVLCVLNLLTLLRTLISISLYPSCSLHLYSIYTLSFLIYSLLTCYKILFIPSKFYLYFEVLVILSASLLLNPVIYFMLYCSLQVPVFITKSLVLYSSFSAPCDCTIVVTYLYPFNGLYFIYA